MATATPSAGEAPQSQPAPEGQGTPSAAGRAAGVDGGAADISRPEPTGLDGTEKDTVLTQSKRIKPIKPLPGVMDEGPIEATQREPESEGRQRDERGRFVARQAEPGTGPTDVVPEPPVDPNAPAKFKFAGREFESQEQAEQNFKSLQGQFKPLIEDRNQAAESARGWHQVAQGQQAEIQNLRAELEAARRGQPQSQPAPAEGQKPDANAGIDWELYAEIRKAADAEGNPWKADRWLQEQQQKAWEAREAALRDELTAPARMEQARAEQASRIANLASDLANYINDGDGQISFPELRDPKQAYEVGKLFHQLGFPPEVAESPRGMVAAIALYRMIKGNRASVATPVSQGPGAAAPAAPPNAAAAAAALAGGRPQPMPSAGDVTTDPRTAAVIAGLRDTKLTRKNLGFAE